MLLPQPVSNAIPCRVREFRCVGQLFFVGIRTRALQELQLTRISGAHVTSEQMQPQRQTLAQHERSVERLGR
jgi:hypothetical protein